ncbi:TPA: hypothetical protein DCE37_01660 [Candidatus Latescibacteria bacterium]|nr:hypothetical protein [Candidatus Latescibacterota bacterium]
MEIPQSLCVSGDQKIEQLLDQAVIIPSFACRLDGFVNDTMTEYANAFVYRPPAVCRDRLVCELRDVVRWSWLCDGGQGLRGNHRRHGGACCDGIVATTWVPF